MKIWTEQDEKTLRKLLLEYPFPLIAVMLNRSEEECKEEIKVKTERWYPTPEEKDLIMALSLREAARLFGVHINKIWFHRAKIIRDSKPKPQKPPSQKAQKLIALQKQSFKAKCVSRVPKPPTAEQLQQTVQEIKSFGWLTAGQARQAVMIARYDHESALRYCQVMGNEVKEEGDIENV